MPIALVDVHRFMALLKNSQPQFRVLGNGADPPTPHLLKHRSANHGHGAVLNNCVALIAGHHAQMKKTLVLGVAHGFECTVHAVAIVLRGLHNRNLGFFKLGGKVFQPMRQHFVICINHSHHFGLRAGSLQCIVQGTCFVSTQGAYMKEPEALT